MKQPDALNDALAGIVAEPRHEAMVACGASHTTRDSKEGEAAELRPKEIDSGFP